MPAFLKRALRLCSHCSLQKFYTLPHPVFAGIAAIFAIQPSIYRSYLTIIEQIQGNLIGAVVAVLFVLLFGHQLVFIGLAAVIIILIMIKLGLEKSISLALVMMIAIMEIKGDEFLVICIASIFDNYYRCSCRFRCEFAIHATEIRNEIIRIYSSSTRRNYSLDPPRWKASI